MNSTFASRYASWVLRFPVSNSQILIQGLVTVFWVGAYVTQQEKKILLLVAVVSLLATIDAIFRKGVKDIMAGMHK